MAGEYCIEQGAGGTLAAPRACQPDLAPETVTLMGVPLARMNEVQAVQFIVERLKEGRGGQVVTVNLDILRRCVRDPGFHERVLRAELVVADGMPLVWASRLQGTPLPERVAGSAMVTSLAEALAAAGRSLYLLGGAPGAADGAAATLRNRYPNLVISGVYCPSYGFENNPTELGQIESRLREARPDVVYVALGSPKQELLIARLRAVLPEVWWLGVGISLSFLAGQVQRAPRIVQVIGLEWLHRLVQEPRRLFRRYLVDGFPFAVQLLAGAAARRMVGQREKAGTTAR